MAPGIRPSNLDPNSALYGMTGNLGVGPMSCNHWPILVPTPAHNATGINTQVVVAGTGTGAYNLAINVGRYVHLGADGFLYPIFPMCVSLVFSAAGEAATVVVVGRDTLGRQVTETLAKGTGQSVCTGLVMWSRIESAMITVNALAAQSFSLGTAYRAASTLIGAMMLPLPFVPKATGGVVGTSNLGWTCSAIPRIGHVSAGGGVFTNGAMRYDGSISVSGAAGRFAIPTGGSSVAAGGAATTYIAANASVGTSVYTNTGGLYGGGPASRAVVCYPNVAVAANVTTEPMWSLQIDPSQVKYGGS